MKYKYYGCKKLTTISIGSGVKNISGYAFANCPELTDVYCYAEKVPSSFTNAFDGSDIEYAALYVPTVSVDAYKSEAPWSSFMTIAGLDGPAPEPKKCAAPVISYQDGKLSFTCDTEEVEFVTTISDADVKTHYGSEIVFANTYQVSVYATKAGYEDSDVVTQEIKMGAGNVGDVGDVNGDGKVTVADVMKVVNSILGK